MALLESQLAQVTARAGVARAGASRAGVTTNADHLKDNGNGQIIWNRAVASDGDPGTATDTFTVGQR